MNSNLVNIIDNLVINKQVLSYVSSTEQLTEGKAIISSVSANSANVIGIALCPKSKICDKQHILALTETNNKYEIWVLDDDPFYLQLMSLVGIPVPSDRVNSSQINGVLNHMSEFSMMDIDAVNYFNIYASYLNWKPFTCVALMAVKEIKNNSSLAKLS